jgi:2-oxoglutarate dehydrogenase E1 component
MDDVPQLPNAASLAFVEELHLAYQDDPASVPPEWRAYFAGWDGELGAQRARSGPSFRRGSLFDPPGRVSGGAAPAADQGVKVSPEGIPAGGPSEAELHQRLDRLIRNFRVRGHRVADLNPLGREPFEVAEIDPSFYGFTEADMGRPVLPTTFHGAKTVGEVIDGLRATYTRSIGAQFMHIDDLKVRMWLQHRMERTRNRLELSRDTQLRILTKLTDAVIFEEFVQKKFVGAKSFSLEGSESLVPLIDLALEKAGAQGVREVVLGMAHRGRLNVLANIMGKSPRTIFREFEDKDPEMNRGRGDVKYHLGYSSDWETQAGQKIHLSLAFNPSHLEFVNAVAMGRVRAKQDRFGDDARTQGLGIVIHGDAAFIGEGIVQETLNMSRLEGYRIGGVLHVIINNQVGFTTTAEQGRSTTYASDVAKMLQSPIFHVNGEDPEAVAQVMEVAMDFRRTFQRDVVIDMYAYRRFGHNEGDEPAFTQPVMYAEIRRRPNVREAYLDRLLALGGVTRDEADRIAEARREHLEQELSVARTDEFKPVYSAFEGLWQTFVGGDDADVARRRHGHRSRRGGAHAADAGHHARGLHPNPKLTRFLRGRAEMADGERPLDWAAGEALGIGSLIAGGVRVRLTGQDSERGTFSQRHTVLHDFHTGAKHRVLDALAADGGVFDVHNSPLSENGVLGFEYGYSLDWPDGTGHVGGAVRGLRQHRAGGDRPVHRLGRGQVAAALRSRAAAAARLRGRGPRALQRPARALPDALRRGQHAGRLPQHARADVPSAAAPGAAPVAQAADRHDAQEPAAPPAGGLPAGGLRRGHRLPARHRRRRRRPGRVPARLLCSGKVYYDLLAAREEHGRDDVAIVRLEQLYPLRQARGRRRAGALRGRRAGRVGAGGAGEHGRLALPARRLGRRGRRPTLLGRDPARLGQPGHRLGEQPPHRTGRAVRAALGDVPASRDPVVEERGK